MGSGLYLRHYLLKIPVDLTRFPDRSADFRLEGLPFTQMRDS